MILQHRFSKLFLSFLFTSLFFSAKAQHGIDTLVNALGIKYPQEKIYLHYDKAYYNAGETIWFKAYINADNQALIVSKTMYAELVDKAGRVLQRRTMPILEYGAASNFDLPDTLTATDLYVRAYTPWMLNFDSSLFYLKPITVINAKTAAQRPTVAFTYKLNFFAEGGDLIENINSRLAFKATDQDGTPINVSGTITDDAGKKITTFASVHDGMGAIDFTPAPGISYKAVWKDKAGLQHETALPVAKKDGVVLSVKRVDNKIVYTLSRPENASPSFTSFTVLAQEHQQAVYAAKINMQVKQQVSAPILADSLQDGVVQITVFNAQQIPVAERLIFLNNGTYYFNTDLHAVEKNITRDAHNTLQVDVGDTLRSNLSISVTDADLNPTSADADNIFAELLLNSDLKGYVYNSAYYFSSDADSVKDNLDLVMMTNGWRRFKWENVLAEKYPVITHRPDNYLTINGGVYGLSKTQLSGREITGIFKTKTSNGDFVSIPLNSDGRFKMEGMYFFDTARLYYQLNNDKDKKLTLSASYKFDDLYEKIPVMPAGQLASLYSPQLPNNDIIQKSNRIMTAYRLARQNEKSKTLEGVTVRGGRTKSLKEKVDEQYSTGLFAGGDAQVLVTEGDIRAASAQSVLEYLQGQTAGLQVSTVGDGSLTWRGSATDVYLDEMRTDIGMIQTISMNDVAMVKIFRPPFFGSGGSGAGGAVAIYTKKGADASKNSNVKGLNAATLLGYSAIKEFYAPDYSKTTEMFGADNRTTLYWNPFILMDANNRRVKIPFYNSDNCKRIKVVIEGINQNGQLTREEKIFE